MSEVEPRGIYISRGTPGYDNCTKKKLKKLLSLILRIKLYISAFLTIQLRYTGCAVILTKLSTKEHPVLFIHFKTSFQNSREKPESINM